jgi:5'-3' exonuclease
MILILDANNMAYRAFYKFRLSFQGMDTSVEYGMLRMIYALMKKHNPTSVVACFDGGTPPFRRALVPTYKANRTHKHKSDSVDYTALYRHIDNMCYGVLPTHGVATMRRTGCEADDIIACVSRAVYGDALIVTSDDDMFQCISDNVHLHSPVKKYTFTNEMFLDVVGMTPQQYLISKVLMGDPSDGIPGVAGIGVVTSEKMVARWLELGSFGDFEFLIDNVGEFKLRKDMRISLLRTGASRMQRWHDAMDLSVDRCGAHLAMFNPNWRQASRERMTRYLLSKGFDSLMTEGISYHKKFSRLVVPELDKTIRYPPYRMEKCDVDVLYEQLPT